MNLKKALSLTLATAMVAGVASVASFAVENKVDYPLDSGMYAYVGDQLIGADTIYSDRTVYVSAQPYYGNGDNFKFNAKKGDNAKLIKKISLVEKDLDNTVPGREWWVKIEINEDMTDKEYKMNPTVSFTAKKDFAAGDLGRGVPAYKSGDKDSYVIKFWIKNGEVGGTDQENVAGTTGWYAKPVKNEDNEVVWSDVNRDLAKLTFVGDSDTGAYYPKLSTKWANDVYAANFADGEAYKFEFVGTPNISATARPTLTIYNPFINSDEEYSVDASELTVYQLIEDEFVDVTDKFTAGTDDDGNQVLTTKTRTLGYYVVCDEAAAASGAVTEEPVKDIPSTGR